MAQRLDSTLVKAGAASSLDAARKLIREGRVTVCKTIQKAQWFKISGQFIERPATIGCSKASTYHQGAGKYFIVGPDEYRRSGSGWTSSYLAGGLKGIKNKVEASFIKKAIEHAIKDKFDADRDVVRKNIRRLIQTHGERFGHQIALSYTMPGEGWDDRLGKVNAKTENGRVKRLMRIVDAWNRSFPGDKITL